MSQNKFYKLWENCGKWGKTVPIRGHSLWSIRLWSGPVVADHWQSLSFLQFEKTWPFMFWIQRQLDCGPVWSSCQSSDQLPTGLWNTTPDGRSSTQPCLDEWLQGVCPGTPDQLWTTWPSWRCGTPMGPSIHKGWSMHQQICCQIQLDCFTSLGLHALWHHFHDGLPDHIKDKISQVGKSTTLYKLHTLVQAIDACYWKCKSEINCQAKPFNSPPSTSSRSSNKPSASFSSGNNSGSFKP